MNRHDPSSLLAKRGTGFFGFFHRHDWNSLGIGHGTEKELDEYTTVTPAFWYWECRCGAFSISAGNAKIVGWFPYGLTRQEKMEYLYFYTPEVPKELEKERERQDRAEAIYLSEKRKEGCLWT